MNSSPESGNPSLRLEILLDSAHTDALIHKLRLLGLRRFVIEDGIATQGFENALRQKDYHDLLGTSRLFVYCKQADFISAKDDLLTFLNKSGGALYSAPITAHRE